jgi:hypothetical protein
MTRALPSRRDLLRAGLGGLGAALVGPLLPENARAYSVAPPSRPARISGLVRYSGKAPRPPKVSFSGGDTAYCRKFDIRQERLLVGRGGGLRNVVVALESVSRGKPVPDATPVLAEWRCTFVPHVLSITAGTKLLLHNRDPVLNTFHAIAQPGGRTLFNVGMPNRDQKIQRRIKNPGLVLMHCDVHPWEEAWVVAVGHPYHAVTDNQGSFALDQVPPGRHTLVLWHEKLGVRKQRVEVSAGAHLKLEIGYPAT